MNKKWIFAGAVVFVLAAIFIPRAIISPPPPSYTECGVPQNVYKISDELYVVQMNGKFYTSYNQPDLIKEVTKSMHGQEVICVDVYTILPR